MTSLSQPRPPVHASRQEPRARAAGDDPVRDRDRRVDRQRRAAVDRRPSALLPDDLSWVVNAYTLTFGGFLLLGGRLADLLGRRRMFMIGLVLFSLASLAGGLAQSEAWLIAARAVQGLGAAIVSPAALSIITTTFAEGAERNRALGIWGAVAGAGGAAGVLLGGILTSGLSWRWVLFVNVPIGLIAAAAGSARAAPRAAPRAARRRSTSPAR